MSVKRNVTVPVGRTSEPVTPRPTVPGWFGSDKGRVRLDLRITEVQSHSKARIVEGRKLSDPERAERKLATVLFADLVGSTELGGSQDPERTRAILDRFYDAMTQEVVRAGGTVEKFAGDAVMAAFGVPAAQEDHVERALHTALAMRRRVRELFEDQLELRIGITSGEVVVAPAREKSSFVTGDVVNVAARLEQAADPGDILVGERAASLVSGAFEFAPRMRVEAKGKPEGVECRKLVRALSLMRPRGLPGLPPTFVGRDQEMARLRDEFGRTVADRRPRLVTVMGDAGIGKTRLMREVWAWLGQEAPDALRRTGRCPSYGHARAYRPIAEILSEHFGIVDNDPPERIQALIGERSIFGLALGLDVAPELHPIVARDRLHDEWVQFVEELASARPLVILIEDLHWAEEPLLELLERMLLEVDAPLLLVATGRTEFVDRRPTWGRGRVPSDWIWLEPLGSRDVDRLVETVMSGDVSTHVRDVLVRAEGNPLFLEELVAMLIERDHDTAIPDSLRALIASRIDLLPPREKAALQAAAVMGRAFWPSSVREILGTAPDFHTLEQRDFIRRSGSAVDGEREFVFKHALTREVAYGSLTRRDRAHLHGEYAAWLEGRGGEREDAAAVLAHHYAEAVRPEDVDIAWADDVARLDRLRGRAVSWLRRAAELAAGRYDVDDALALLKRALELETDDRAKIENHRQIAHVHTLHYDAESFRRSMEDALALDPDSATAAEIYAELAYYGIGRPYIWRQQPPREVAESWLERALELSDPGTKARGFAMLTVALSDPEKRAEASEETLAIGKALGDPRLAASAFEAKAMAATEARKYDEACDHADRALEASVALTDPGYRGFFHWNAGFIYLRAGRIGEVRRFVDTNDQIARSLSPHEEVHAIALRALLESVLGRWDVLAELAQEADAAAVANADFACQFNWRTLLVCALGPQYLGDEVEARRLEATAHAGAIVFGPAEREPALLRLALLRGDLADAERILAALPAAGDVFGVDGAAARLDALAALGERERLETEAAPFVERRSYTHPFALRALGLSRDDAELVERAASEFELMGLDWRATETRALV
jgi:class 3 adenylate cyclase/tetratricopeptide (TPR) repeat protein